MCTRPDFGVLIGYFTIFIYSIGVVTFLCLLANQSYIDKSAREAAEMDPSIDVTSFKSTLRATLAFLMSMCLMMVALSGVMVRGIKKRRHKYMVPWMLLVAIGIGCTFIYNVVLLFKAKNSASKFISGMITMAIQCLILYPIYTLYKEVREENEELERAGRTGFSTFVICSVICILISTIEIRDLGFG